MKAIHKILVPIDFSPHAEKALQYALALAGQWGAVIDAVHVVFPEYEALDVPVMTAVATQKKLEAAREVLTNFVDAAKAKVSVAGKKMPLVNELVELGTPVSSIVETAERDEADLILMGTQGEHNRLERMFGSVSSGVLERTELPVWVIPADAQIKLPEVVAYAAELKPDEPYLIWKAAKMLAPMNPIFRCVHVKTADGEAEPVSVEELKGFFAGKTPTLQVSFHEIREPSVAEGLDDFTDFYQADLLIMSTHHRNVWDRFFHKSQTRQMALSCRVPLLVIKD